jgi:hypothetical protein
MITLFFWKARAFGRTTEFGYVQRRVGVPVTCNWQNSDQTPEGTMYLLFYISNTVAGLPVPCVEHI